MGTRPDPGGMRAVGRRARLHACEIFDEFTTQPLNRHVINETLDAICHLH